MDSPCVAGKLVPGRKLQSYFLTPVHSLWLQSFSTCGQGIPHAHSRLRPPLPLPPFLGGLPILSISPGFHHDDAHIPYLDTSLSCERHTIACLPDTWTPGRHDTPSCPPERLLLLVFPRCKVCSPSARVPGRAFAYSLLPHPPQDRKCCAFFLHCLSHNQTDISAQELLPQ